MREGIARARHVRHRRYSRSGVGKFLSLFLAKMSDFLGASATEMVFIANDELDTLNIVDHGISEGEGPYLVSSDDTLPGNLVDGTFYWAKVVDVDSIQLTLNRGGTVVDITDVGVGTHTLVKAIDEAAFFKMLKVHKPETIASATDVDDLN